jgi:Family of unknown function (DUF5684)
MKNAAKYYGCAGRLVWLLFLIFFAFAGSSFGQQITDDGSEPKFALFQTKTCVYTNVTVTQRTKDWVFILHSQGVCNIKTSDLTPEMLASLGYKPDPADGEAKKSAFSGNKDLAKIASAKFADVKHFAVDWRQNGKERVREKIAQLKAGDRSVLYTFIVIVGSIHLLVSALFWLICRKTHISPGPLVWLPVFQLIPLLRAANMPWPWFFAYFIPVLNIIAQIVWCVKIVKSRGKSPVVAFFLLFPITSLFAFLYLAFSSSAPVEIQNNEVLVLDFA